MAGALIGGSEPTSERRLTPKVRVPPSPRPTSPAARKVMQANRSRDTTPERAIRSELHRRGLRFFKHRRPLADYRCTADIVFPGPHVCVFIDGCFWHGCREHRRPPRGNAYYWGPKIELNMARDRRNDAELGKAGWTVVRIWEHESIESAVTRVLEALEPG